VKQEIGIIISQETAKKVADSKTNETDGGEEPAKPKTAPKK
jgi:hypothetical protein